MEKIKVILIFIVIGMFFSSCNLALNTNKNLSNPADVWTTLNITNDSSKILKNIAYSGGKVYYDEGGVLSNLTDLKPGQSCKIKIADKNGDGFIHFTVTDKLVRTQNRYTILSGGESNVTITDNTPLVFNGSVCLLSSL